MVSDQAGELTLGRPAIWGRQEKEEAVWRGDQEEGTSELLGEEQGVLSPGEREYGLVSAAGRVHPSKSDSCST